MTERANEQNGHIDGVDCTLYIFCGLPGTGKSTLGRMLATWLGAVYLRIDTVEDALRDLLAVKVEGEGYRLAYRLAADNLRLGQSVVADSCNPIALTRDEWQQVAAAAGARPVNIEVICSNREEHRGRVEAREFPTWADVEAREYHAWSTSRIVIDTAGRDSRDSFEELLASIAAT